MKGNEGVQSQNEEKQRPQAQKLENRLGHGADKFFVWDLGTTESFWQLVGGTVRGRPPQEEMLLNMDHPGGRGPPAKSSGFRVCTFRRSGRQRFETTCSSCKAFKQPQLNLGCTWRGVGRSLSARTSLGLSSVGGEPSARL